MSVGVVFASTGGQKMVRALRSLRRTEPELFVHIILDTSSNTWKANGESPPLDWFERQPNVKVRCVTNTAYINGALNAAMRWMAELGYNYGCLLHDDVVFSPFLENQCHLSRWFDRLGLDPELKQMSALSLSYMQAFVPNTWRRSPLEWNAMDLESEPLWRTLCPGGQPIGYFTHEEHFADLSFFVQYYSVKVPILAARLGPTGQIVPVKVWEEIGGFDEQEGIFYDMQYPAECAVRGKPPVLAIPNTPHLHLHNQTIGFSDPAVGLWADTEGAFARRYGKKPDVFWRERGCFQF